MARDVMHLELYLSSSQSGSVESGWKTGVNTAMEVGDGGVPMAWCWYWRPFVHCHRGSSSSDTIVIPEDIKYGKKKLKREHTDGSKRISSPPLSSLNCHCGWLGCRCLPVVNPSLCPPPLVA